MQLGIGAGNRWAAVKGQGGGNVGGRVGVDVIIARSHWQWSLAITYSIPIRKQN